MVRIYAFSQTVLRIHFPFSRNDEKSKRRITIGMKLYYLHACFEDFHMIVLRHCERGSTIKQIVKLERESKFDD